MLLTFTAALFLAAPAKPAVADHKLSPSEASGIVEAFRLQQERKASGEKNLEVSSLDAVTEVLKRDDMNQFEDAVDYVETLSTPEAKALRAQIELAWGDAQNILAELLERTSADLAADKQPGGASPADLAQVVAALRALAATHLDEGGKVAQEVIKTAPKNYQGYRVAADFYRLQGDWKKFDEMKKKIESTNAKSNGLVFLRGMEQLERYKKPEEAAKLFHQALKTDPQFTRAQAMLVLLPQSSGETYKEYKALEALSPYHLIVLWVGPRIERLHNEALFTPKK
jgi:tetratricopeptide (TPR) repeat protein